MKHFSLTFSAMILVAMLSAQNASTYALELRTGLQKIDERSLLPQEKVDAFASTYLGITAQRRILGTNKRLQLWAGLSIGQEQQNFNRDITSDWCRFCVFCDCFSAEVLTPVASYRQYVIGAPVDIRYQLVNRLQFRLEYRPDFVFRKREVGGMNASWNGFEFLDHNLRPSINYQIGRCQIGVAANLRSNRKLDPFYYEQFLRNGLTEAFAEYYDFGKYQPVRFDLSVGYSW